MNCFYKLAAMRELESEQMPPQQEWGKHRSQCGVSYRLRRCHLFEGVSQQSSQCQLNIPLELYCNQAPSVCHILPIFIRLEPS